MVNNSKDYKEVQHCYYNVLDNIENINRYFLEIETVLRKIDDISEHDIYAAEELIGRLSNGLQEMFFESYGDEFKFDYSKRCEEDLEMIKKIDPERAKKLKKQS